MCVIATANRTQHTVVGGGPGLCEGGNEGERSKKKLGVQIEQHVPIHAASHETALPHPRHRIYRNGALVLPVGRWATLMRTCRFMAADRRYGGL